MIDIQFIRDNPDLVQEKAKQKGYDIGVKHLLELDLKRKSILENLESARSISNQDRKSVV